MKTKVNSRVGKMMDWAIDHGMMETVVFAILEQVFVLTF